MYVQSKDNHYIGKEKKYNSIRVYTYFYKNVYISVCLEKIQNADSDYSWI